MNERLSHCPICEYPLTGLPVPHRCPECGYAYDTMSRVWISTRSLSLIRLPATTVLLAAIVSWNWGPLSKRPLSMAVCEGVLLFWAAWIIRFIVTAKIRSFVSLGPAGVALRLGWQPPRVVPWSEIRGFRRSNAVGRDFVSLVLMNGSYFDLSGALHNRSATDDFVQAFRQRQSQPKAELSKAVVQAAHRLQERRTPCTPSGHISLTSPSASA
jgi:hypothetical protein